MKICHLFEAPECIPTLAGWFAEEWEPIYGEKGSGDAEADLRAGTQRDALPLWLVALDEQSLPLGTVALKTQSVDSHRHLAPWISSLIVGATHQRQGVGTALVEAIIGEARRLNFKHLYVAADRASIAAGLFKKYAWDAIDEAPTYRGPVTVYRLDL